MREEQKKVIQKEMDRLEHLGIIHKGLTSYSSPVVLVKWKNQNLYRVCSDFCILNEKLVKINHALSRLHNFTDTPDQKDIIPLNFLQHFTPNYIEHSYSHLVENLYAHKTKTLDAMTVKSKHGRPPKTKATNSK